MSSADDTLIEVRLSSGDRAEADSPENALYAARTLAREASERGCASSLITTSFYVDGVLSVEHKGAL